MKRRVAKIRHIINKNFNKSIKIFILISLIICLFIYLLVYILSGINSGKKGANYTSDFLGPYSRWVEAGKPEDFQNFLDQYNIKYKKDYIYSNIVFNINGKNVHTLYTKINFYNSKNLYAPFLTTEGHIVELYRSGDVRVIKDCHWPPVGPPR